MKLVHKKYIIAAAMLASSANIMAQGINSAYYTDDYKFRHTMNPAFANEQSYFSIPALGNVNVSMHGNFGYQDVVRSNPWYGKVSDKKKTTFMHPGISVKDALNGFSKGNNRILGDIGITILSAGFKAFGGYNTIELNSKTSAGVSIPYGMFEFAKNTGYKTYNIGDINARVQSYAEIALGHSRQINDKLRVGAKLKFLLGIGRADVQFKDIKADLASNEKWIISGNAKADVSMKGFEFKSEEKEYNNPSHGNSGKYETIDDIDVDGAGLGGFGMAVDLGGVYKINDDWTVNAALLDLGFIGWSNNVTAVNKANKFEFNGFHDTSVSTDHGATIDNKIDDYDDQLKDFANLTDEGDKGGRSTGIGATLNVGCEYNLPAYRKMTFGFLSSTRINGPYTWTEGRLSANWTPMKWIDGGVNLAVNSFTTSMGWALNIHPKGYNFFVGMDHILGKMSKEGIPLSSNANVNVGMSITW